MLDKTNKTTTNFPPYLPTIKQTHNPQPPLNQKKTKMADKPGALVTPTSVLISTSIVVFISGFMLGVYSIRGYFFVSPTLASERRKYFDDPPESEESDVDEDDTILDHAPNWSNGVDADRRDGLRLSKPAKKKGGSKKPNKDASNNKEEGKANDSNGSIAEGSANEECKLVLVVRTDLGMTKGTSYSHFALLYLPTTYHLPPTNPPSPPGKIAAQCSHATLACYKKLSRAAQRNPSSPEARLLQRWEHRGQAKIAVQVKSEAELIQLMGKARSLGITAEVIQDAGRTQIDPGSLTVLGVGPAPKSVVDGVTGGLKLLWCRY